MKATGEKKIIGYTDSVNECDCCGKYNLKGTYCVSLNGSENYFGSVCAFKIHAIDYDTQNEIKKSFNARKKASQKLIEMESENRKDAYWITKMYKFAESKNLNLNDFILKYGKVFEDNKFYTAYQIGNLVKIINK